MRKPKGQSALAEARPPEHDFSMSRERFKAMASVAGRFDKWRPAVEGLVKVQAVPTIFPQLDVATRLMGWPTSRFALIHGPSGQGKSSLVLGLMLSFLERGHFAAFVDAERTTPVDWVQQLYGEMVHHPGFKVFPTNTYEEVRGGVRQWAEVIGNARAKGEIPEDMTGICVVDSIRKLMPKKMWQQLSKDLGLDDGDEKPKKGRRAQKPKGIDGAGGRGAQIKAALNSQWMDELVPLMADTRTSVVVIARETENPDRDEFGAEEFKVGGGAALNYEASLRIRVQSNFIKHPDDYNLFFGERHILEVYKTKVGGRAEKRPRCFFHTSNGAVSPAGFDRARDVLELAKNQGLVEGSWYKWGKLRLGQGIDNALKRLRAEPELMARLELEARNKASESW